METVIGIDFGTQSARAVLVNARNGEVLCKHCVRYPHGVMTGDLACIQDYDDALLALLSSVTPEAYRESVRGICVDATSLTLVPVDGQGRGLALLPQFAEREHAQIKLWKRHTAQPYAQEALALAGEMQEPFLQRTGGTISGEWMLPKLLEIRDQDPDVYAAMDAAFDLCEYLTHRLTGSMTRSVGAMSYKCLWASDLGLPSEAYLNRLRPGLAEKYGHLLRGRVLRPGEAAGVLRENLGKMLGLPRGVVVASGALDGHTSTAALGAMAAGDAALVVGTSNVLTVQTDQLCFIPGICGIARDGLIQGMYGIDSGQGCTGDMLEWFMKNQLPTEIEKEAAAQGISVHQLMGQKITAPWNNPLTLVDWWNGSRNMPCDLSLSGTMTGVTLETKPQDVYLAMLQAIACGTREILAGCGAQGVTVRRVLATGGITEKNPLLMQEYANILNLPVWVGQVKEGPALGAAIFAAVASGLYPIAQAAYAQMGVRQFTIYQPDGAHRAAYEGLYQRNHALRGAIQAWNRQEYKTVG